MKLKYIIFFIILILVVYKSVYFKPLDSVKSLQAQQSFDAKDFANSFWTEQLLPNIDRAVEAPVLLDLLETDPAKAQQDYSKTVGIASVHYYFLSGQGRVLSINDEGISISVRSPQVKADILVATQYIFGNAVRDATGKIDVSQFSNSLDFNNVAVQLNSLVTAQVIEPFVSTVKPGMLIKFAGAAEVSEDETDILPLRLVPVMLEGIEGLL